MEPPRRAPGRRAGFNLVEIMITLTMVALLTSNLISFVNDFDDKSKTVRAKNDLMQLAQAALIWESRTGKTLTTASVTQSSEVPSELVDYLVELPPHDPWGRRFTVQGSQAVLTVTSGTPYVLDASFGRFICAGPDGVINTQLGRGASDNDNDIVVEYRQQPWLAYASGSEIWMARADGTRLTRVYSGVYNVTFSPDGTRWAGVAGNSLVLGSTSAENPATGVAADPTFPAGVAANNLSASVTYPFFFPDGTNVGFINGDGSLRVVDTLNRATRTLLPPGYLDLDVSYDPSDTQGRIIHVSNERTYYWKVLGPDSSIGIAVASDGKIAYGAYGPGVPPGDEGIHLVLPGGTGDRVLKKRALATDNWYPLFWIDSSAVAYYSDDGGGIVRLRRVNQDGRFDISLYDEVTYGFGPKSPVTPTISPQGNYMACFYADNVSAQWGGYVLRTDGGGFIKQDPTKSQYLVAGPTLFQEGVWSPISEVFYVPSEDVAGSTLREVDLNTDQPPAVGVISGSIPTLLDTQAVPGAMRLNSSGTLMAVVSHPQKNPAGSIHGVYVYPILGPVGSVITIATTMPADEHVAVTWVAE